MNFEMFNAERGAIQAGASPERPRWIRRQIDVESESSVNLADVVSKWLRCKYFWLRIRIRLDSVVSSSVIYDTRQSPHKWLTPLILNLGWPHGLAAPDYAAVLHRHRLCVVALFFQHSTNSKWLSLWQWRHSFRHAPVEKETFNPKRISSLL